MAIYQLTMELNVRKFVERLHRTAIGGSKLLLVLFSIGLLALAPVYAARGHIEVAATFAGLFVLSIATLSLPRLQSFEGFSVKLQLAEEVRKAEITLDQLKALARSSLRQGFLQVRSLPMSERRTIVAVLNNTIEAAKVSDAEAAEIRRPMMDDIAQDLFTVSQLAASHLRLKAIHAVDADLRPLAVRTFGAPDPLEPERTRLETERHRLLEMSVPARTGPVTADSLSGILDECLADFDRDPDDDRRLRAVLRNARRIMGECLETKSLTQDYEAFTAFMPFHVPGFLAPNDTDQRAERLLRSRFGEG